MMLERQAAAEFGIVAIRSNSSNKPLESEAARKPGIG